MHTDKSVRFLLVLFFVSGATSLTYQVLWMRELQLVFGTSTFAVSAVLASFMAGLAAGGFAIARVSDRIRRPLAVYGLLELGIGLYALIFPLVVAGVTPVYLDVWRAVQPGPVTFGILQFSLVGILLILPTAAMGATLPLLARFATHRLGAAGNRIGTLYAVNTFGAVAGICLCSFVLLPQYGLNRTTAIAVAANVLLGIAALGLERLAPDYEVSFVNDLPNSGVTRRVSHVVCIAIGLAGFSALVYEVAWTRLLALMLGSSAYTSSIMLVAFLTGIGLGGRLGGPIADRLFKAGGWPRVLYAFAVIEIGIAVLAYATMYAYPELPFWYVRLFHALGVEQQPEAVWWVSLLLAGLVMTPASILMGMHFPMAVRALVGYRNKLGFPVGITFAANSIGGAAGAFLAGFVLLPKLKMQGTIFVAIAVGLVAAVILVLCATPKSQKRWIPLLPIALVALVFFLGTQRPPWNPLLMTSGMYHYAPNLDDHSRQGIMRYSVDLYDLVYYEEGLSSVITVADNAGTSHRWLAINGKVDASTTDDMPTQILLSLLPMQFVEQPEEVLVIGLASGVSAGAAAQSADVRRLNIVELEPAIGRAAEYFAPWNHAVLSDARVTVTYNDGRNHLLLTEPESFDIVISEPSNPWISGVANLFTRDFLAIGKSRLKPGGVWSQWVPIYGMDSGDLRTILKTFADVYQYVLVYASIEFNDLVLIGSDSPLPAVGPAARQILERPALAAELARAKIFTDVDLVSLFIMDRAGIVSISAQVPINTDDNMYIEYSTAKKLHVDMRTENYALLLEHAVVPDALGDDPGEWVRLAVSYWERGDTARSNAALQRASRLASDDGRKP